MIANNMVKVWNRNTHPHTEKFKGKSITVPAQGSIEMEFEDAVDFLGQFTPIERDGAGQPLPKSYKMLDIEKPSDFGARIEDRRICMKCKGQFASDSDLVKHIEEFHLDAMADADAKDQLEREAKRGSGRPSKGSAA